MHNPVQQSIPLPHAAVQTSCASTAGLYVCAYVCVRAYAMTARVCVCCRLFNVLLQACRSLSQQQQCLWGAYPQRRTRNGSGGARCCITVIVLLPCKRGAV
jgi:hypothetical protein